MPPIRVLIVDDDPIALQVARAHLMSAGYSVRVRDSALGTSAVVLRERPDFVLVDVDMPGLTGDRLVSVLSANKALRSCLVLYSSCPAAELESLRAACGAVGYIEKTGRGADLLSALNRLASQKERSRALTASSATRSALSEIEELDPDILSELLGVVRFGDSSFLKDLSEAFVVEAEEQILRIDTDLRNGHWAQVREAAHKIKGSGRNVGALRLARVAEELEDSVRTEDAASAGALLVQLRDRVRKAHQALLQVVQRHSGVSAVRW